MLGHAQKRALLILGANALSILARDGFYFAFNYIRGGMLIRVGSLPRSLAWESGIFNLASVSLNFS